MMYCSGSSPAGAPTGARSRSTGIGPVIDREALRAAGRVSSPAFRIGVAVPTVTWIPGVTRPPMRGVGGVWTGDVNRYPVLSGREPAADRLRPDECGSPTSLSRTPTVFATLGGMPNRTCT